MSKQPYQVGFLSSIYRGSKLNSGSVRLPRHHTRVQSVLPALEGKPRGEAVGASKNLLLLLLSCSGVCNSFTTLWNVAPRLLCPWDVPGKNAAVGCHSLLQGIFLTQGLNPQLLHSQADSSSSEPPGKPQSTLYLPPKLSVLRLELGHEDLFQTCFYQI